LRSYCRENEDIRIGAVRYWREKAEKIMEFEERHPANHIRLFYEDLCEFPEQRLMKVFDFIGEPWEPSVMDFYKFAHDKGREDGRVIATRGFSVLKGYYLRWPRELVAQCHPIAKPILDRLGYGE
jgi:hypothetical protein